MAQKKKEELGSSLTGVSENTMANLAKYQAGYQEGEKVGQAYNEYTQLKDNAPQAYVSPYQQQLDDLYTKIVNRQPFQYNLNGDALYQNAKEQYQQMGKQAMVDTMGQAAQLTGGYGNSYAQNVGNQAYQQYLLKLNEQIPTYYNLAMQRYQAEGDALKDQYGMLGDRENQAYARYRDTVSDYNQNLEMAYNIYNNERDNDYGQYRDALDYWQNQAGAENKDYWTQANFDYQKEQDALAQRNWEREQALAEQKFQAEMAYKYAALAQSRAEAEAKKKAEEEAKKKAEEDAKNAKTVQDIVNSRYASNTALGLNSNGIGVALNVADTIRAQATAAANKSADNTLLSLANQKQNATVLSQGKDVQLKKFDLGSTTGNATQVAQNFIKSADAKRSSYKNEDEFQADLNSTLRYYYNNGYISEETARQVLKKYGII